MKTILYATDYSENSVAALHYANAIRLQLSAKLVVLHVYNVTLTMGSTTSLSHAKKEVKATVKEKRKLIEFCDKHLGLSSEKLNITLKVTEKANVTNGILSEAKSTETHLIIVGTLGGNILRKYLLGSTTMALIEKADCAILAIPPKTPFTTIKKIVYASDYEGVDIFAIQKLVRLAEPFKASIYLVHVTDKETTEANDQLEWFKNMLQHKISYENIYFETRFATDIFEGLRGYIYEIVPDIVAILERDSKNLIKRMAQKDLVKRMKVEGILPLWSYHKKNIGS